MASTTAFAFTTKRWPLAVSARRRRRAGLKDEVFGPSEGENGDVERFRATQKDPRDFGAHRFATRRSKEAVFLRTRYFAHVVEIRARVPISQSTRFARVRDLCRTSFGSLCRALL